jgi:predicted histidine transporter YuiF (NhaC family)
MNSFFLLFFCPMCKSSIANAENATELSQTVNIAVLVLLIPTITIIIGLAGLIYKYRHPSGDESQDADSFLEEHL